VNPSERLKAITAAVARPRIRNPLVVTGSVLAHAVVLSLLALNTFDPPVPARPYNPPIYLEIEPRPLLEGETPRIPRVAPASSSADAVPSDRVPLPRDLLTRPEDEDDEAVQADARSAAPGAPGSDLIDPRWLARPADERARVARSLRTSTLGCNARNGRMPAAEQALCDEAFNEGAARARPISGSGNAARDARFAAEGRREMEAYEARRRPLAGGTGVTGVGDCPGSNFGMGCPGAHLDPGFRQDSNDQLDQGLGDRRREPEE
jgi:hypothetical protein|tara:strand:- start:1495 stop:2286 length:792 start_codon:yes stop_codon:yes gene_type:complete